MLDAIASRSGRSMSALIRDAVRTAYGHGSSAEEDVATMRRAFGAWRGRALDGADYVEAQRSGCRLGRL